MLLLSPATDESCSGVNEALPGGEPAERARTGDATASEVVEAVPEGVTGKAAPEEANASDVGEKKLDASSQDAIMSAFTAAEPGI